MPASTRFEPEYNLSTCLATLKISNALKNDLGEYTVLAENKAGRDKTSCKLFITMQPNIDETPLVNPEAFKYLEHPFAKPEYDQDRDKKEHYYPPRVIVPLSNIRITEGDNILLMCKIDGYPKPKVRRPKIEIKTINI